MSLKCEKLISENLTLDGQLVELSPPAEADYPSIRKILSDPVTMRHMLFMANLDQGGWTIEQITKQYEDIRAAQAEGLRASFIIHDKKSGAIAGSCSLKNIDSVHKNAEFGIIVHHPYWGRGMAAECHLLVLEYGFEKLGLHRIEFLTLETNTQMRRFFEKVGINLECIKRDLFFERGSFIGGAIYATFEDDWDVVKSNIRVRLGQFGYRV